MKTLRASFLASMPRERLNLNSVRNGIVSLASVPDEKDEFPELRPPVVKSSIVVPKLMTEKRDSFKKRCGTTRKSVLLEIGRSTRSDAKQDTSSKPLNFRQENVDSPKFNHGLGSLLERPRSTTVADSPPCDRQNDSLLESIGFLKKALQELSIESTHPDVKVKPENLNNPEFDIECGEVPEIISSSSVTVHNVPSAINLSQLKEAISVFGKISNAIVREVPTGFDCCDVEFECAESRDRAVTAGRVMVENFSLLVRPADVPEIAAVGFCNIRPETAELFVNTTGTSDVSDEFN